MVKREVGRQKASQTTSGLEFEFAVLVCLPGFWGGVDEVLGPMNGNGVVAAQPVDITLQEIKHSIPSGTSLTHRAEVERLGACGDFTTHRYPMTPKDRCLGFVNHLAANANVDVFGADALVIVGTQLLFDPCLSWTFEPGFKSAWGPHLPFKRRVQGPEPVLNARV